MLVKIADAVRPIEPEAFVGDMIGGETPRSGRIRLTVLAVICILLLGLLLLWQTTPLQRLVEPERLIGWLESFASRAWAPLAVVGIYVAAGLAVVPVTLLIVLTAMTFGPWLGTLYAMVGSMASAAVTYQLGALVGKQAMRSLMGPRLDHMSRKLAKRGIVSVATARVIAIAPFTFVNVVAGASHIRFSDYMLGTLLGMLPVVVMMTALGGGLRELWEHQDTASLTLVGLVLLACIGLTLALQRLVSRRRG